MFVVKFIVIQIFSVARKRRIAVAVIGRQNLLACLIIVGRYSNAYSVNTVAEQFACYFIVVDIINIPAYDVQILTGVGRQFYFRTRNGVEFTNRCSNAYTDNFFNGIEIQHISVGDYIFNAFVGVISVPDFRTVFRFGGILWYFV